MSELVAPGASEVPVGRRGERISFVLPFYNEGVNVDNVHTVLNEVTAGLPYALEFVFVNDGSADDTLLRLKKAADADPRGSRR